MEINGLTYTYPGEDSCALRDVSIRIRPGECHVVTGPTGSGKSTLALALKGMLPETDCPDGAGFVGLVLQNPSTQIIASSIGAEAAFGLENLCIRPEEMPGLVREALGRVGLDKPLGLCPRVLSMGEKYRLLVAAQLVMGRRTIVLDEPSGQLDGQGLDSLAGLIGILKRSGISFVICEHMPEAFRDVTDALWRMEDGSMSPADMAPSRDNITARRPRRTLTPGRDAAIADGLVTGGVGPGGQILERLSFTVPAGAAVSFTGPNGAGKTTLLRCMSGGIKPLEGVIEVLGDVPARERLRGRIGYMPQNPDAQLFEDTVLDEVSFSLRRSGRVRGDAHVIAGETLERLGISGLAGRSPHRLSYGQKRLVCLASLTAASPELLLLDAPLTGLDPARRTHILGILDGFTDSGGTVAATSHDHTEFLGWTDHEYAITGGKPVAEVV